MGPTLIEVVSSKKRLGQGRGSPASQGERQETKLADI